MKKFVVTMLSIVVLAALFNPSAASAATATERYSATVVKMTNAERTKRHLVTLKGRACLTRYANRQASRMARANRMYHQDLGTVMRQCKLKRVGENVALGYGSTQVVKAWMGSPGHRKNILTKPFRRISVGARKSSSGRWYVSQVFGTPR